MFRFGAQSSGWVWWTLWSDYVASRANILKVKVMGRFVSGRLKESALVGILVRNGRRNPSIKILGLFLFVIISHGLSLLFC